MSYDILLVAADGSSPDCPNPTYNLTEIFDYALTGESLPNDEVSEMEVVLLGKRTDRPRGLRLLSGMMGRDSKPCIDAALGRLLDSGLREKFIALEPPNKWGDLTGAIWVMERLSALSEAYPDSKWDIH